MRLFVDANVLVSVLNKEYPIFSYSSRILSLADTKRFKLYTSPVCLSIAFYFAEKKSGNAIARRKIGLLCNQINISSCDESVVLKAISNKKIHDLEDGIEYYSAIDSRCECIVTEDIHDFYFSDVEILTSKLFLEKYLN